MSDPADRPRDFTHMAEVLVVGAGMAGLAAASDLHSAGHDVLVVDKGRGVGGRLANRRIGEARFDHGAQFFTTRDARFTALVQAWADAGVARAWYRDDEGMLRWRGEPAMTALAKALARDVRVLLGQRVDRLEAMGGGWCATLENGETVSARAALLTAPVPQSLALLEAGNVALPEEAEARLRAVRYAPCLAVMAVLEGPSLLPAPGALALPEGPIAWLADNRMKGISERPAVTIHATAAFSAQHLDGDRQEAAADLLRAAASLLGTGVVEYQVHGWRYSKPLQTQPQSFEVLAAAPPLVLAGDAFGGPRVEGAALSGWAAADVLRAMLLPDR